MILECYRTFGFDQPEIEVSTRPDSFLGELATWEKAESSLMAALDAAGLPYKINRGDGAFYGPKIDFKVRDALRRSWQLGTVPARLPAARALRPRVRRLRRLARPPRHDPPGHARQPRALLRRLPRARRRPLPDLARPGPGRRPADHRRPPRVDARGRRGPSTAAGLRVETDLRSEKLGLKIREATLLRVPYMLVLGDKEVEARGVAPRSRDGKTGPLEPLSQFVARLVAEAQIPSGTPR
jgi:threonyl-tRNA synthetase